MSIEASKLKKLSLACRILICLSVVIALIEGLHPLVSPEGTVSMDTDQGMVSFKVGLVPIQARLLVSAILLIPAVLWICGLLSVWKMCNYFRDGKVFEVQPMRCFEIFGWMIALTGIAQVFLTPLITAVISQSGVLKGATPNSALDFSSAVEYWVAAIVIALIARILKESVVLAKEVESFV